MRIGSVPVTCVRIVEAEPDVARFALPVTLPPSSVPPPSRLLLRISPTPSTVSERSRLYDRPLAFGVVTLITGTPPFAPVVWVRVGVKRIGAVGSVMAPACACRRPQRTSRRPVVRHDVNGLSTVVPCSAIVAALCRATCQETCTGPSQLMSATAAAMDRATNERLARSWRLTGSAVPALAPCCSCCSAMARGCSSAARARAVTGWRINETPQTSCCTGCFAAADPPASGTLFIELGADHKGSHSVENIPQLFGTHLKHTESYLFQISTPLNTQQCCTAISIGNSAPYSGQPGTNPDRRPARSRPARLNGRQEGPVSTTPNVLPAPCPAHKAEHRRAMRAIALVCIAPIRVALR